MKLKQEERSANRRSALIKAATRVFLSKGYRKATNADIIRLAGGSMATIYKEFGDKAGLFRAVLDHGGIDHKAIWQWLKVEESMEALPAEEALYLLGSSYMHAALTPQSLAIHRIVVGEASAFPEAGQIVLAEIHQKILGKVSLFLQHKNDNGLLLVGSPQLAAEAFLGIIRGELFFRAAFDPRHKSKRTDVDRYVRFAVQLFLRGMQSPH